MKPIAKWSKWIVLFGVIAVGAQPVWPIDIGEMINQMSKIEKTAEQPMNLTQAQPVRTTLPVQPAQQTIKDECAKPNTARQAKQSTGDSLAQSGRNEKKQAECERAIADIEPEYAETSEALEIKGIKVGMKMEEFLKLHPQGQLIAPKPGTNDWRFGDQIILFDTDQAFCGQNTIDKNPKCNPLSVMYKQAYQIKMIFIGNRLSYGEIYFSRFNAAESGSGFVEDDKHYFDELVKGLTRKYKAEPPEIAANKLSNFGYPRHYKIIGWKNNSCKCELIALEDAKFTNDDNDYVLIKLVADSYLNTFNVRQKILEELTFKAISEEEQRMAGDL